VAAYLDDVELFFCFDSMFLSELKVDCFGEGFGTRSLQLQI